VVTDTGRTFVDGEEMEGKSSPREFGKEKQVVGRGQSGGRGETVWRHLKERVWGVAWVKAWMRRVGG